MAVALANVVLLAPLPPEARLAGALVLFVGLPGWLFVQAVFCGPRPERLERWLLALGCGYVLATLLALALHILFRPLLTAQVLLGANALNGGLLLGALARRAELRPRLARPGGPLLAVLAVAAPLRLYNLGHSEFQGDEARVVLRGLAVLQGVPDALISHRKPPGEVLLDALFAGGLGSVAELTGRLPFALAGAAAVLACYCLGRALFGPRAARAAALLLAVNGYFVAFSRMLQYQGVALLLDVLAILCLFRFARGPAKRRGYAVVGALLLAGAGLMALSAVFLLPVAALALWPCLVGPHRAPWRQMAVWLWPLALLVPSALTISLLLPSNSSDTLDLASIWLYLGPRLGERRPYFNLERFLLSASHYTSSLYLLAMLLAGAIALFVGTTRASPGWKLVTVWLAGPLVAHLFLVRIPFTHWREVFPGLVLLVGVAAAGLYARLPDRRARLAALLAGGLFLVASGHYVYVAWIQPWPEYQTLYPRYRHPLDWTGRTAPLAGGIYGLAHRHGWKAVAVLMASGQLPPAYSTNESPAEAAWYLKSAEACGDAVQLVIRALKTPRDYDAIVRGEAPTGYTLLGRVYVAGRPTLALLGREPPADGPRSYHAEAYGRQFDRELASPWASVGSLYRSRESAPGCPGGS